VKLTDAFAKVLKIIGVGHVFGLQGGAVVHFFDSIEKSGVGVTYTHHEESAALAAVAYAKATGVTGCAVVTTGPGCTNAITGLLAAWQDSVPCLFISGQARSQHTSYGRKVRQVGTQEVNICDIVKPITKYAKFSANKDEFLKDLAHAIKIANNGRPGPVWLDVPLDIQWEDINFSVEMFQNLLQSDSPVVKEFSDFFKSTKLLEHAKKPLLVLGYGVHLSKSAFLIEQLVEKHSLPLVTTWTAADLFPSEHQLNLGVIGMSGQRGANKALYESDLLICLGTHLSIPHTTTLYKNFAPNSKKIAVNIDLDQLNNLNVDFDLKINSNLRDYLVWLNEMPLMISTWSNLTIFKQQNWYEPKSESLPNSNTYVRKLTARSKPEKYIVVDGGGTALYAGFQSSIIKKGDRIICSSAISSMGTGLAEVIGVSKAGKDRKILCIIGDGSFLMNIQDLQTISQDKINVIISVINNNGYAAIRHTQKEFLGGKYFGTHPEWSLQMPSISKLASAFEIPHILLNSDHDMENIIESLLNFDGPIICEVQTDEDQEVLFKQGFKANEDGTMTPQNLSEMHPFVKR
jgi:acetolactate synthase-1/2/3 large subunit